VATLAAPSEGVDQAEAAAEAGGDPLAMDDLLSRIARCLPPDMRPRLIFSSLILELGPDGALQSAPQIVTVLPRVSSADTLAADRVVQAALQCGPYGTSQAAKRTISLVPDFSSLERAARAATKNLSHESG
jgi:hypothetical protein